MNLIKEKGVPLALSALEAVKGAGRSIGGKFGASHKSNDRLAVFQNMFKALEERIERLEKDLTSFKCVAPAVKIEKARPAKKAAAKADTDRPCQYAGCTNKHMALGLCKNHYYQFKRGSLVKTDKGYEKIGGKKGKK